MAGPGSQNRVGLPARRRDLTAETRTAPPGAGRLADSPAAPGFPVSRLPAVNVSQVPQRSPLRYPGGKSWLIPHVRAWLRQAKPKVLIEPFAGGGTVSLTAVMEGLAGQAIMLERDHDVAAFWFAALRHGEELAERVRRFRVTRETVEQLEEGPVNDVIDHGFRTLVLNRTRNAGILAPGASLTRQGENGKGVQSRWYPGTLADRIEAVRAHAHRISFCEADAMTILEGLMKGWGKEAALFVDPPYTAGGKSAGSRLYAHHVIDHAGLFRAMAAGTPDFLMTYDRAPEAIGLVRRHGFAGVTVRPQNAHNAKVAELVITRRHIFG